MKRLTHTKIKIKNLSVNSSICQVSALCQIINTASQSTLPKPHSNSNYKKKTKRIHHLSVPNISYQDPVFYYSLAIVADWNSVTTSIINNYFSK